MDQNDKLVCSTNKITVNFIVDFILKDVHIGTFCQHFHNILYGSI